jgi:cation transport ATPase
MRRRYRISRNNSTVLATEAVSTATHLGRVALNTVSGVDDVQVSLASGEVTVRYDENLTSIPRLKTTVIKTGFGVDGVRATNGHDPRPDYCG